MKAFKRRRKNGQNIFILEGKSISEKMKERKKGKKNLRKGTVSKYKFEDIVLVLY